MGIFDWNFHVYLFHDVCTVPVLPRMVFRSVSFVDPLFFTDNIAQPTNIEHVSISIAVPYFYIVVSPHARYALVADSQHPVGLLTVESTQQSAQTAPWTPGDGVRRGTARRNGRVSARGHSPHGRRGFHRVACRGAARYALSAVQGRRAR